MLCEEYIWEFQSSNKKSSVSGKKPRPKRPSVEVGEGDTVKGKPDQFSGSTSIAATSSKPVVVVSKTVSYCLSICFNNNNKAKAFYICSCKGQYILAHHSKQVAAMNRWICHPFWPCVVHLHESPSDLQFRKKGKNIY